MKEDVGDNKVMLTTNRRLFISVAREKEEKGIRGVNQLEGKKQ